VKKKPKLRKGEQVWWTIAKRGKPLSQFASDTKSGIDFVYPYRTKYLSDYKPVKIAVRLV